MSTLTRLTEHYDSKYRNADFRAVQAVPLVERPGDRRQMAVYVASQNCGGKYLEIGAGDGGTLLALVDKYDQLVGTDLSAVRVQELKLLFQDDQRVQVLHSNLEIDGLPFPDNEFDTAAMIDVIEHLFDPITALREIRRILKPEGRLIVHTPNIAKWSRRIKLLFGYFPSTASLREGLLCYDGKSQTDLHDEGHLHYFTFRSLRRLALERCGFRAAEIRPYGKPLLVRAWPEMFSELCVVLRK